VASLAAVISDFADRDSRVKIRASAADTSALL
jgi:hypothetical protein